MLDEELKQLVLKNQKILESLEEKVSKIQRKMLWSTIGNILKIVLIAGPIIVGIIYLLPFVREYFDNLGPLLFKFSSDSFGSDLLNEPSRAVDTLNSDELRALIQQYCNN